MFGRVLVELFELLHRRHRLIKFGLGLLALPDRPRVISALHPLDAILLALDEHTQASDSEPDGHQVIVDALFAEDGDVVTRATRILSLIQSIIAPLLRRTDYMPGAEVVNLGGVAAVDKEEGMAAFDGRARLGRDREANGTSERGGGLTAQTGLLKRGTSCLEVSGGSDTDLDVAETVAVQDALALGGHGSTVVSGKGTRLNRDPDDD